MEFKTPLATFVWLLTDLTIQIQIKAALWLARAGAEYSMIQKSCTHNF